MTTDETEALSQSYFSAFQNYKDSEIIQAADDYLHSGEFFPPRPHQIISLVKNAENSKHTRELIERYTCASCHRKVSAISDGLCLDCAGFPPAPKYEYIKQNIPEKSDYIIESRIKCQECGKVGMCIKEPGDHGSWRCRECYTGLTGKQITQRWKDLIRIMEDKSFKPSWIDDTPF